MFRSTLSAGLAPLLLALLAGCGDAKSSGAASGGSSPSAGDSSGGSGALPNAGAGGSNTAQGGTGGADAVGGDSNTGGSGEVTLPDDAPSGPIPDFGPNVIIFDPSQAMSDIQSKVDAIKGGQNEFAKGRYAFFFKPGTYQVDVRVGYYTQVIGLGQSPDDVSITGAVRSKAELGGGNATTTFWKAVENFAVTPTQDNNIEVWAISQGTSMRRVHVKGSMNLWDDVGSSAWSSGGFVADSKIDGKLNSGTQQQFFTRTTDLGTWSGGSYNMVFVGDLSAPMANWPKNSYSVIEQAPVLRDKPYLYLDKDGNYFVRVPSLGKAVSGPSWGGTKTPSGRGITTGNFYVSKAGDTATTLNAALDQGKHLLITPGVYHLDASLQIKNKDTVVMGLGLATLIPDNGTPAITIADVDGVRVSGLLLQAGGQNSDTLLQVGSAVSTVSHAGNPTSLQDISCRIGGGGDGTATTCVTIESNDVLGENLWLWRADHGADADWNGNKSKHGLIVDGQNVTMYALFAEHFQEYQTMWNGNGGQLYFYQSELPYDPPDQGSWQHDNVKGYASYKVADTVTSHTAMGLGVYAVLSNPVTDDDAIEAPAAADVHLNHMVTTCFGGSGTIAHIFNGTGNPVSSGSGPSKSDQ